MKTLTLFILAAGLVLGQNKASVRVVVTDESKQVLVDVTIPTTDEELSLVNQNRQSMIKTPAVAEVKGKDGNIVTPAVPEVLTYPTRADWWKMLISSNIRSIAGNKTKAFLAKQAIAEKAQADANAEKEKVAR